MANQDTETGTGGGVINKNGWLWQLGEAASIINKLSIGPVIILAFIGMITGLIDSPWAKLTSAFVEHDKNTAQLTRAIDNYAAAQTKMNRILSMRVCFELKTEQAVNQCLAEWRATAEATTPR